MLRHAANYDTVQVLHMRSLSVTTEGLKATDLQNVSKIGGKNVAVSDTNTVNPQKRWSFFLINFCEVKSEKPDHWKNCISCQHAV